MKRDQLVRNSGREDKTEGIPSLGYAADRQPFPITVELRSIYFMILSTQYNFCTILLLILMEML